MPDYPWGEKATGVAIRETSCASEMITDMTATERLGDALGVEPRETPIESTLTLEQMLAETVPIDQR